MSDVTDVTDPIDQLWQRIESPLSLQAPPPALHLAAGSSDQALDRVEEELRVALPEDFRASYRRHDGGFSMRLVTDMEVLSLARIVEAWQILEELLRDEEWARTPPYYFTEAVVRFGHQPGPIQPVWWSRHWIPFATDRAGNHTCLDLAPAAGGARGQIIDWDHECGPSRVLFPDFAHLLAAFADQVEHSADTSAG
jgi:cell wall assembly regulator SMI1